MSYFHCDSNELCLKVQQKTHAVSHMKILLYGCPHKFSQRHMSFSDVIINYKITAKQQLTTDAAHPKVLLKYLNLNLCRSAIHHNFHF